MADIGHNLNETTKMIEKAINDIRDLKGKRKSINEDIAAIRENLQSKGVHKQAFDFALRYLDMDVDKRQSFDVSYALVREAGGLPLQGDLFMAAEKLASDVEEKKEAAKPTAKEIAERKFEQTTRKKLNDDEAPAAPKSPDANGILEVLEGGKSEQQ